MKVNLLDLTWVYRVVSSQGAYPPAHSHSDTHSIEHHWVPGSVPVSFRLQKAHLSGRLREAQPASNSHQPCTKSHRGPLAPGAGCQMLSGLSYV